MIIMKKIIHAALAACMAFMAISCQDALKEQTGDETGMLYGTWVLDTYKIEASASVDGEGGTLPVVIPYATKETTLHLDESLIATAHMGWETEFCRYSYDGDNHTLTFGKMLEVSDDGRVMVLKGKFNVVKLDEEALVLEQPYLDLGMVVGSKISTKSSATYTFHRKK